MARTRNEITMKNEYSEPKLNVYKYPNLLGNDLTTIYVGGKLVMFFIDSLIWILANESLTNQIISIFRALWVYKMIIEEFIYFMLYVYCAWEDQNQ